MFKLIYIFHLGLSRVILQSYFCLFSFVFEGRVGHLICSFIRGKSRRAEKSGVEGTDRTESFIE
jgi:hypothetical protein